jgi:flagellin-specific chaperone FliS
LLAWVSTYTHKKQFENSDLCELILITINNVAHRETGSNALKAINMIDTLKDFWNQCGNNLSEALTAFYFMAYALIVTLDESKSATVLHDVIDYLTENINIASHSSDMRTFMAHNI